MAYSTTSDNQCATIENLDHDQLCLKLGELEQLVFISECLSRGDSDLISHHLQAGISDLEVFNCTDGTQNQKMHFIQRLIKFRDDPLGRVRDCAVLICHIIKTQLEVLGNVQDPDSPAATVGDLEDNPKTQPFHQLHDVRLRQVDGSHLWAWAGEHTISLTFDFNDYAVICGNKSFLSAVFAKRDVTDMRYCAKDQELRVDLASGVR